MASILGPDSKRLDVEVASIEQAVRWLATEYDWHEGSWRTVKVTPATADGTEIFTVAVRQFRTTKGYYGDKMEKRIEVPARTLGYVIHSM